MHWGPPLLDDDVGPPATLKGLLDHALAADPANSALSAKLGYLHLSQKRFADAAASFEIALKAEPSAGPTRRALARCYVVLGRPAEVVTLLKDDPDPSGERARALIALGRQDEAEAELRALLAADCNDPQAIRMMARLLRERARHDEIVDLCKALSARGAANGMLFHVWGWSLAMTGDDSRARSLLFDADRLQQIDLGLDGDFAAALAEDILTNPNRLSEFATEDDANRGSSRVEDLLSCARPALIRSLFDAIEAAVSAYQPAIRYDFDPWCSARPTKARLRAWGLIQRGDAFEEGHIHPGGWLSGVYYARVPSAIAGGSGRGAIEFGPPSQVAEHRPGLIGVRRVIPREGLLLLSPSHYQHRTIPSHLDEDRVSLAFDVVPDNS